MTLSNDERNKNVNSILSYLDTVESDVSTPSSKEDVEREEAVNAILSSDYFQSKNFNLPTKQPETVTDVREQAIEGITVPPPSADTGADLPSATPPTDEALAASRARMSEMSNGILGNVNPDFEELVANPLLEVMDAVNANTYGTVYDIGAGLAMVGNKTYNKVQEMTGGEQVDWSPIKPDILRNKQFVADDDSAAMYDTAALFATYGVAFKGIAQQIVSKWKPQFIAPTTPKTVRGRVAQDIRQGGKELARMTAESPLTVEAGVALTAAAAGAGVENPTTKMLVELVGGVGFGLVKGLAEGTPQAISAAERIAQEYGVTVKEVEDAAALLRQAAENPNKAANALEAGDSALSTAAQTGDTGILTLERTLAQESAALGVRADEGIDLAAKSLMEELKSITNPDGSINSEAFTAFVTKRIDNVVTQIDDRIALAHRRIQEIQTSGDLNAADISRAAKAEMDALISDIAQQEKVLWKPISESQVAIDTTPMKQAVQTMLKELGPNQELDNAAKESIERILGVRIGKTDKGWEVQRVKDKKTGEVSVVPVNSAETLEASRQGLKSPFKYTLPRLESPSVIAEERSRLLRVLRALQQSPDSKSASVNPKLYSDLQQILIDGLEEGVQSVAPNLRQDYLNALKFTKAKHSVLDRSTIVSTAKKAPQEKVLETLVPVGGRSTAAEAAQGTASREVQELFKLWKEAGEPKGNSSNVVKSMQQYLLRRFAAIDATDADSINLWLDENRTFLNEFPELGAAIRGAVNKIKANVAQTSTLEGRKNRALNSKFVALTKGKTPVQVIQGILDSDNPVKNANRLALRLAKDPDAKLAMKRTVGEQVLREMTTWAEQSATRGAAQKEVNYKSLSDAMDAYSPLLNRFFTKDEIANLNYARSELIKVSMARAAKGAATPKEASTAMDLLANVAVRTGLYKLLSATTGVSSFAITGAVGKLASKVTTRLAQGEAKELLEMAMKNKELMKLLLDPKITMDKLEAYRKANMKGAHLVMKLYGINFMTGGQLKPTEQ